MMDEFKPGDVIMEIGMTWWRYLVVAVRERCYEGVPFGPEEKINVFSSARPIEKDMVHANYVKIGERKIPRWIHDRVQDR